MEKYRECQKELHCTFVDLKKTYDRVFREELCPGLESCYSDGQTGISMDYDVWRLISGSIVRPESRWKKTWGGGGMHSKEVE